MANPAFRVSSQTFRRRLLSAAAALALVGAGATVALPPAAHAEALAPQAASGPASFADVVERVKGAVVAIKVKAVETQSFAGMGEGEDGQELAPDDPLGEIWKHFGEGRGGMPHKHVTQSQGSGFVISADGYVVTNNHVVEHAKEVEVTFDNGKTLPAKIIGTDKRTDLALLKVTDGGNLPYVEWSNAAPRVGDWVIAVGNPFGLGGTVTAGIVSARGRDIQAGPYDDFLQIDAPVNRGNSGGPTFDERGGVVGVNTAIYSPSGGSVGIGFAIPTEVAKDVVAALKEKGAVTRGWIGVQIQPVTQDIADSMGLKSTKGALVASPAKGGPAEAAGLKSGDVIVSVNGDKVEGPRELSRKIAALGPGKSVDLSYLRGSSEKTVNLKLGTLPAEKDVRAELGGEEKGATLTALGIDVVPASQVRGGAGGEGLYVTNVNPEGPAAQKGLRRGDIVLEAGGKALEARADLVQVFDAARKEGRKAVLLRVKSAEGTRFVALPATGS